MSSVLRLEVRLATVFTVALSEQSTFGAVLESNWWKGRKFKIVMQAAADVKYFFQIFFYQNDSHL